MQLTTLVITALLASFGATVPIELSSSVSSIVVARQSNPLSGILSGVLTGGQQSDSDGEGNAVATSECGLLACTSGSAASAESGNSTSSSSSSSSSTITLGKRLGQLIRS